jgi:hypothetical protein
MLRLHGSTRFQGLFHSPRRGTFHRSLTVLCAIGQRGYVALEGGPPSFPPGSSCPAVLRNKRLEMKWYPDPAITVCGGVFQAPLGTHHLGQWTPAGVHRSSYNPSLRNGCRLDTEEVWAKSRFVRHYYGNTVCSSGYVRCFSSPGSRLSTRRGAYQKVRGLPH